MPAKGQKRKQQIIDTAKEMFIKNGFQSTHIGQVCEKLNIARGTVYQYFGNKREILYAVLEQVEEKIDDILDPDDLKDFLKGSPSQKALLKFVNERLTACIQAIVEEPIVMKLIFKDIVGIDKEVVARVNKFLHYITTVVTRNTEEIQKKGIYKKTINSEIASMILIGAIMFIVYEYDQMQKNVLDDDLVNNVATSFLHGIAK